MCVWMLLMMMMIMSLFRKEDQNLNFLFSSYHR
ncbi:putative signal peptide protein [Puccinia sorghi]|uniref:Putative signal peptide protein n=1 Tax=Puccinia sorghi TaxID=27349 RepID=A0A0L6UTQ9_9BASI|nr:putative signal peptide protein [Puccinia sorghi]